MTVKQKIRSRVYNISTVQYVYIYIGGKLKQGRKVIGTYLFRQPVAVQKICTLRKICPLKNSYKKHVMALSTRLICFFCNCAFAFFLATVFSPIFLQVELPFILKLLPRLLSRNCAFAHVSQVEYL